MAELARRSVLLGLAATPVIGSRAAARPRIAAGVAASPIAEALRLIDLWLDAQCAYGRVPALSAGVVSGDNLIWAKGYGGIATPRTRYGIGSITKLFTAVAVMRQVQAGRLDLDGAVSSLLPWAAPLPTTVGDGPITVRHLLSHSSGLPREASWPVWSPPFAFPTDPELERSIPRLRSLFSPGAAMQYSNLGPIVAGQAAARVANRPFADLIETDILAALEMGDSRLGLPTRAAAGLALGHGAFKRDGTRDATPPFDVRGYAPSAGLVSTVEDLARFASWQFRLLRTGDPEILNPETLRMMHEPQSPYGEGGFRFGLGFAVFDQGGQRFVAHSGEVPGYRSALRMHPASETAVIVMRNTSDGEGPWASGMAGLIAGRLGQAWAGAPPAPDVPLEDFAGRYEEQPWGPEGLIVPWAGGLAYLSLPSDDPAGSLALFKPKGGDLFRRVDGAGSEAEEIVFERDPSGRVIRFVQHGDHHERLAALP